MALDAASLIRACAPVYHFDRYETEVSVNLAKFVKTKAVVADDTVSAAFVPAEDGDGGFVHYFLFFMKDAGMSVFGVNMGSHDYDVEQTVVRVDRGAKITGIQFKPHNSKEHFWITDTNDLKQIVRDGHPQIYVSRGKHGCYPVPGTIIRYLGFISDVCDRPVRQNLMVEMLPQDVVNVKYIGIGFPGIKKRLLVNPAIPSIRLSEVRLHNVLPVFR